MHLKSHRSIFCVTFAATAFLICGCGKKNKPIVAVPSAPAPSHQRAQTLPPLPIGYTEEGVASWYGIPYHGRKAADGETYDMETLVAAHKVMPFNTWLRVTNLSNNKNVVVRIIDRGPFVDGRIIDLSKAAARQIDLLGPGIGRVRLEVVAAPADIPADDFYAVQVGVFSVFDNAERLRGTMEQQYGVAKLFALEGPNPRWRVLVGKEPTVEGAQRLAATLSAQQRDVFVVRLDEKLPAPAPKPPPGVWQDPSTVTFDPSEPSSSSHQRPDHD